MDKVIAQLGIHELPLASPPAPAPSAEVVELARSHKERDRRQGAAALHPAVGHRPRDRQARHPRPRRDVAARLARHAGGPPTREEHRTPNTGRRKHRNPGGTGADDGTIRSASEPGVEMTDELLVENGDITLRVEVTGDGPDGPVRVRAGPSWRRRGATRSPTCPSAATGSPRWTSAATAAARRRPRSSATRCASWPATSPRSPRALDDGPIVLVGHDWGAPIVWSTAVRHPDRVRAVAGLSVPYTPPIGHLAHRPLRPALRRPVLLHAPLPAARRRRGRVRGRPARCAQALLLRAVR